MLSAWVSGESRVLVHQLKKHSDPAAHAEIEKLLSPSDVTTTPMSRSPVAAGVSREEFVSVSLRLQARDARLLRALGELEGEEAVTNAVSVAVRDRMKVVARTLID